MTGWTKGPGSKGEICLNVPVELRDVLEARDRRVRRQQALLDQYGYPLVSFTMNIAGPVKQSPLIEAGFHMGCRLLEQQLARAKAPILHREVLSADTGCEALYAVDLDAAILKALTVELEDGTEAGRLFDMDVIAPDGKKLDRASERGCLICGRPGPNCARSRAHTVGELQKKTADLLTAALLRWDTEAIARHACRALLYEVAATPKPGLVDRRNSGSHRDMDIYTFFDSTAALWPYFQTCAQIGRSTADAAPERTFAALRLPGKLAENAMLDATGGVNTHKGAIFTLGVLCAALGRLPRSAWSDPARPLAECAAMVRGLTQRELSGLTEAAAVTAGQRLFVKYGVTGVRGQVEAGLPTVLSHGLPALEQALAAGQSKDEAGCAALLALMSVTPDTNLMTRGGRSAAEDAAARAAELLACGWDAAALEAMDREFQQKNLSPGGCADLLSVCWFLHFIEKETE